MPADSFFEIGYTHEVCEDYARHVDRIAVVSDGCSNGYGPSIDSDWGSRFLTMMTLKRLIEEARWDTENLLQSVWQAVGGTARSFMMDESCLTATLMIAQQLDNDIVTTTVGDGVIGGRRFDGSWLIRTIDFEPGGEQNKAAPFYLKYAMINGLFDHYMEQYGGEFTVTYYDGRLDDPAAIQKTSERRKIDPEFYYEVKRFPLDEFDLVFVGTDGLQSFREKVVDGGQKFDRVIDLIEVLGVLLDVNSYRTGFLRHLRNWNWKRPVTGTFLKRGWRNADDVSVAAIYGGAR